MNDDVSEKYDEDKGWLAPAVGRSVAYEITEDEIDRNLMESFPASDPPSWTLGIERERPI